MRQHKNNGYFLEEEEDKCLYDISGKNDKFKDKIIVINFIDVEEHIKQLEREASGEDGVKRNEPIEVEGVIEVNVLVLSFD